ncbi:hypothetical protein KKA00_04990 [bacterium]|nr:hypothetical protein [bacterium]MBU1651552.1 hypothetical protein [bacterium]MBU1882255.1 hypothetical protein [bacterium]
MFRTHVPIMLLTLTILLTGTAFGAENDGYIYGSITTRDGDTYTGTMRWGKQEVFWDDLFNASKDGNPWLRYLPNDTRDHDRGDKNFTLFGIRIHGGGWIASEHLFICQFGEIKSIKNRRNGRATLTMKNDSEVDVTSGGDIDVKIRMIDENLGTLNIDWDNIRTIDFKDTPKDAKSDGYRLRGKVITYEKEFDGFVMWDAEECISSDVLDGESDNGDMEIEFGNIRSIKRMNRRSCLVTLKDGREFKLRGTNDVNEDNRGIYVWDDRYGKTEIGWNELQEVIYQDKDGSGKGYDAYKAGDKLKGTVKTVDGGVFEGDIVYDLDEAEGYEILNGSLDDMEFNIPFHMVKSITPKGRHAAVVELRNGEKLRLEDGQDVSDSNDGILIFMGKGNEEYVVWDDVETVIFK